MRSSPSTVTTSLATLVCLTSLLIIACGGSTTSQEPPAVELADGLSVRLLDPGAPPQSIFVYDVADGRTDRLSIAIRTGLATAIGDAVAVQATSVPFTLNVRMGPVTRLETGGMRYDLAITGVTLDTAGPFDDETAAALTQAISPLLGVDGWIESDESGRTVDSEFEGAELLPIRTRTMLANIRTSLISIPFPTEPIGIGGRWEVRRTVDLGGITVEQVGFYTLVELGDEGRTGRLIFTLHQSGTPRTMTLDSGVQAHVDAYETMGVGEIAFHLGSLAQDAAVEADNLLWATVTRGAASEVTQSRLWTSVRVTPEE